MTIIALLKSPLDPLWSNVYFPFVALRELKVAFLEREQRIVAAPPDILTGMDMGAALTNDDVARFYELPGKLLYAEALGF